MRTLYSDIYTQLTHLHSTPACPRHPPVLNGTTHAGRLRAQHWKLHLFIDKHYPIFDPDALWRASIPGVFAGRKERWDN
eukprot:797224-Amorphochlora_amoeboformis.AAC.1